MMKRLLIILVILLTIGVNYLFSQSIDTLEYPCWMQFMYEETPNLNNAQKTFDDYWRGKEETKGCGANVFKRWLLNKQNLLDQDGNVLSADFISDEQNKFVKSLNNLGNYGDWKELGPDNLPTLGSGRINCLAYGNNTLYAGSPSGGLWKKTGTNDWTPITDMLPVRGVSSIIVNGNTIYIGTGDRDANYSSGTGVYKSIDGGSTWNQCNIGMGNVTVNKLLQDPLNSQIIIAATSKGIFKTINGGGTWILKTSNVNYIDIEAKPNDFNIIYAVALNDNNRLKRSIDAGETFPTIITLPANQNQVFRTELAVTTADANLVFAVMSKTNGAFAGFCRSTDAGLTFNSYMNQYPNILGPSDGVGSEANSQGFYDLTLGVDPANYNNIYVGGINLWKLSTLTGEWSRISHWDFSNLGELQYIHADHHDMLFATGTGASYCYLAHDGGVSRMATSSSNWEDISAGLRVANVYNIGQHFTDASRLIAGLQDAGTIRYLGAQDWQYVYGGDGLQCAFHPNLSLTFAYASNQMNTIVKTPNYLSTSVSTMYFNPTVSSRFNMPFMFDRTNNLFMYIAGQKLIRCSYNPSSIINPNVQSNNYTTIGTQTFSSIDNNNIGTGLVYGAENNKLFWTFNPISTTPTWIYKTFSQNIMDVEHVPGVSSSNYSVYVVTTGKLYKYTHQIGTIDEGGTITDMDPGNTLPAVGFNCVVIDVVGSVHKIYLGTTMGVFFYDSANSQWVSYNKNFPATINVRDLQLVNNNGTKQIVAATFGRSTWRSNLQESYLITSTSSSALDCSGNCTQGTGTATVSPNPNLGGTYTYLWSNGQTTSTISNLCPGTYQVTITHGTNVSYASVIVGPSVLSYNLVINDLAKVCEDDYTPQQCSGSVTITPTGGFTTYSVTVNNSTINNIASGSSCSFNNLCNGFYSVNITGYKNGISTTCNVSGFYLEKYSPISVFIKKPHVCGSNCTGFINIDVVNGGNPKPDANHNFEHYHFTLFSPTNQELNTGVIPCSETTVGSNLCAGNYRLVVTDADNCSTDMITFVYNNNITTTSNLIPIEQYPDIRINNGLTCGLFTCTGTICAEATNFKWYQKLSSQGAWTLFGTTQTATLDFSSIISSTSQIFQIYVTYELPLGTPHTSIIYDLLLQLPSCDITGDVVSCSNTGMYFAPVGNYTYSWSFAGGTITTPSSVPYNTQSIQANLNPSPTSTAYLTVTDISSHCVSSCSKAIAIPSQNPPPTYNITSTSLWINQTYYCMQDLIVNPGTILTLRNTKLYFAVGKKIIVKLGTISPNKAGAKLVVNYNSLLTNIDDCDHGQWGGIVLEGKDTINFSVRQPWVETMGNSTSGYPVISNASSAITSKGGAVVRAYGTHFINNTNGICFETFTNTLNDNNLRRIVDCSFTFDNQMLFPTNNHVMLTNYAKAPQIWNTFFRNLKQANSLNKNSLGTGVYAFKSYVEIDNETTFNNLTYGIHETRGTVSVKNSIFRRVYHGIYMYQASSSVISSCEFINATWYCTPSNMTTYNSSNISYGIWLGSCMGYTVNNNTVTDNIVGLFIGSTLVPAVPCNVSNNYFGENNDFPEATAILCKGINHAIDQSGTESGLELRCNDFYHNNFNIAVVSNDIIYSTIKHEQGYNSSTDPTAPAGNTFVEGYNGTSPYGGCTGSEKNFHVEGSNDNYTYYYHKYDSWNNADLSTVITNPNQCITDTSWKSPNPIQFKKSTACLTGGSTASSPSGITTSLASMSNELDQKEATIMVAETDLQQLVDNGDTYQMLMDIEITPESQYADIRQKFEKISPYTSDTVLLTFMHDDQQKFNSLFKAEILLENSPLSKKAKKELDQIDLTPLHRYIVNQYQQGQNLREQKERELSGLKQNKMQRLKEFTDELAKADTLEQNRQNLLQLLYNQNSQTTDLMLWDYSINYKEYNMATQALARMRSRITDMGQADAPHMNAVLDLLQLAAKIDTLPNDSMRVIMVANNIGLLNSLLNGNDAWAVQADMLLSTYTNKPFNDIAYLPSLTNSSKNKVIFKPVFATTNLSSEIKLYPNPANKELQVEYAILGNTLVTANIHNSLGQLVYSKKNLPSLGSLLLDVSTFEEGIYFIDFDNEAKQKFSVVH